MLKNIFKVKIGKKLLLAAASLLLIAVVLPVLRLALFATPFYDDYNYAVSVKTVYEASHSFIEVIKEACWVVKVTYLSWQGTYSSVFFMALMPASFGMNKYCIGIVAIILMLAAALVGFVYSLFKNIFKAEKLDAFIAGELIASVIVLLFHSAQQGIYWYNGAVHYTLAHSFMLIMLAFSFSFYSDCKKVKRTVYAILVALLSIVAGGTNYVTALQGLLLLLTVSFFVFLKYKKRVFFLVPGIVLYAAGFLVNALAPGNASRQGLYEGVAKGPIESILLSFKSAFMNLDNFTGLSVLAAVILLIPIFVDMAGVTDKKPLNPAIVGVLGFCFYATGFTPSWFGMGSEGLARTLCAVKITFLLVFFFFLYVLTAYIVKKIGREPSVHYWPVYALSVIVLLISFVVTKDKAGNFMTYGAYYYIHTGEAYNYKQEQMSRDEFIKSSGPVVELEPLVWRPWFLCKKNELDSDPTMEQNQAAARWYGKEMIYVNE